MSEIPAADLKGLYLGHAAENVRDTFEKARAVSPTILFIDELVIVTPHRDGGSSNDALAQKIVSQMLQEMDVIVSQRRQVFVLAATNHPENIDDAILSRFTNASRFPFQMLDKAKMKKTTSAEEVLILGQPIGGYVKPLPEELGVVGPAHSCRTGNRRPRSV